MQNQGGYVTNKKTSEIRMVCRHTAHMKKSVKKKSIKLILMSLFNKGNEVRTYVRVSSGSELFDSTVWSNVFNDVTERSFVQKGFTTTRLLLTTFRLHQFIQTFLPKE